ncbi:hypothetical protein DERP_009504 [Dermatophagoides pteronyssinus]|uniref:Uncharacterized protein n=1 Tax=Dermatophagoides pteronyssinus TaxID=6956 RepID=A0ABQ8IUB6_DERPT|nr:hypothetical protein DERP_009504 [Dermatophagoides pteronyssinus]
MMQKSSSSLDKTMEEKCRNRKILSILQCDMDIGLFGYTQKMYQILSNNHLQQQQRNQIEFHILFFQIHSMSNSDQQKSKPIPKSE